MPASVACHATKRQHKTTPKRPNRLHLNTAWWCTLALHWLLVRVGRVCLGGENLVLCSARSRSAHSALYQKCALLIRCTGHTHPCFARFASLHAACSCCAHAAIRICRFAASAVVHRLLCHCRAQRHTGRSRGTLAPTTLKLNSGTYLVRGEREQSKPFRFVRTRSDGRQACTGRLQLRTHRKPLLSGSGKQSVPWVLYRSSEPNQASKRVMRQQSHTDHESRRRCGRVPAQMWASPGADVGDKGESRSRCGR